jgi:hypothetical protein
MQMAILVHLLFVSLLDTSFNGNDINYSIRNGSFFQAELRGPVKKRRILELYSLIMDRDKG